MSGHPLEVELHPTIESIVDDWEALANRTRASPFDRPGWIAAWWHAFGTGDLEVIAVRDGGELAAVLPIVRHAGGLCLPTNAHTPSFAPIGSSVAIARAWDAAFATRRPYLRARFLAATDPLRESAHRHGYSVVERIVQQSPYVPLEGFAMPKKTRARIGRLHRHGTLELDVSDGSDDLDGTLRQAFELEGSGWKTELGTAIVSDAATLRFYKDVAMWAAPRGMLRLAFLRLDGRAIAADFVLLDDGRTYDVKGGYDPAYRKLSPGLVLQGLLIEWARDQGCRTHELLGDADQWKLEWTDQLRPRFEVVAVGGGRAGRIACGALARALPLARTACRSINRRRAGRARARDSGPPPGGVVSRNGNPSLHPDGERVDADRDPLGQRHS